VLDFGIAKALATRTLVTTNRWGSIQYASPERLQSDGHINEHADFWSLGVMLFEMVAGYRPYRRHEHNPGLLDHAIRKQDVREPLPPGTDPVLSAIIHKLLAPQIERRYETAAAIARDLDDFMRGEPTTAGLELARAGQETIRLPAASSTAPSPVPRSPAGTPTEPLPVRADAPPPPPPAPAAAPLDVAPSRTQVRRAWTVQLLRLAVVALLLTIVATEALALIRAERLRMQIPTVEVADIASLRDQFQAINTWTPIGLGAARISGPLAARMLELAEQSVFEFRMETPAVAKAQWEGARDCLDPDQCTPCL
jgi:hypothetical protein